MNPATLITLAKLEAKAKGQQQRRRIEIAVKARKTERYATDRFIAEQAIVETILDVDVKRAIAARPEHFDTIVPLLDKRPWSKEERRYLNDRLEQLVAPD